MARSLVTIGTDQGYVNWVRTPDGVKRNLGSTSVLKLVVETARSVEAMTQALDTFLADGEAVLDANLGRLEELLAWPRSRWAADSLISAQDCKDQRLEHDPMRKLAYEDFRTNADMAEAILDKAREINAAIDAKVEAGKKFNSRQAKLDVHEVVSKTAGILQDADLSQPWVKGDLTTLHERTTFLHGLFYPPKAAG